MTNKKNRIAAIGLIVLGITITAMGVLSSLGPPIITGIGFFLVAWVFLD